MHIILYLNSDITQHVYVLINNDPNDKLVHDYKFEAYA